MTIEKLLQNSAEKLESMTDEELYEFFKPYLIVTRPELCSKPAHSTHRVASSSMPKINESKKKLALEILAQFGRKDIKI